LTLAALVAVALVLTLGAGRRAGRVAPPLPGSVLAGKPTSLAALRGQPVLVDFFASWCGPCAADAGTIGRAGRALQGHAHLVAIDWSDNRRDALAFIGRYGWSFPVLADPNGKAGYAYGIQGLPSAFVLDAQGRIVRRLIGPQTLINLLRAVRQAARE
jgi:cytochrome c biogenesis protein CcmG/thiol:disulfide interchange protein DsbE